MREDPRQERLKETLLVLEGVAVAQRREWVTRRLADDPALLNDVLSLLAASEHSPAPLLEPLVDSSQHLMARHVLPGRIGPYTVEALLGQGGMSNVYRAFQVEPVRRIVAVKVLRAGFLAQELLSRFEIERDSIAKMSHPNIANLLDAGTDDMGCPYIAMDLVDGPSITEYVRLHQLPVRNRLSLFLEVCRGVQHAHRRGILHRDIKPSNILVAEIDGQPEPKVIDFGLAKLLNTDPLAPGQTMAGQVLGTLAYMSPEQADPQHPDADVRSDVYSLGVVLYELLTDTQPISAARMAGLSASQIHELLRDTRPVAPSQVGSAPSLARSRDFSLGRLSRELDCIVLKSIEPDSSRRYAGVGELIADIERLLSGHPILARPPEVSYRLRKFIWRHRWPATLVGVVCIALIALAFALAVGYRSSLRQRDRAERAAATFEETNTLLRKYLLTPRAGPNGSFREIVARGADDFMRALPDSPTVRARVAQSLGESLYHAGDNARAKRLLNIAVDGFQDPAFDSDTNPRREALLFLSLCRLAGLEQRDGRDVEAIERYRSAIKLGDRLADSDLPLLWTADASLANTLAGRGEFEEALTLLDNALSLARGHDAGQSFLSLLRGARAGVLGQMERFDEAISEGQACFTLRTGPNDKSAPYTIMLAAKHGSTLLLAGEPAQAAEHLRQVLLLSEQAFGRDHAQTATVRRLLAEAEGVSAKDPRQLEVLAALLAQQPDPRTREALCIRKSRVAVLAAQGQIAEAIDDARRLVGEVDALGTNNRESAVLGLDLARGMRLAAPQVAKELASKAALAFERDLGVESIAAKLARKLSVGRK